ncbi:MAG: molybdopterin molybdotransferase MoeA [Pseudomonadota bacterium]
MISVKAAQALCLDPLVALETELLPLADAANRTLRTTAKAHRPQPPFAASAMDGYALQGTGARPGATFQVVGEAAAGHGWNGRIGPGDTLRIFTGAPVPTGADRIIIQEDVDRVGDTITLKADLDSNPYVRPAGADFPAEFALTSPRVLVPSDLALLAAMNIANVAVTREPHVALIATGDELVMPGGTPRADQIIASNIFGLKALIERAGGTATILPIAKDTAPALRTVLEQAVAADLIVTIGGASVGDHDLVGKVAQDFGLDRAFYKIAMRPGKPLMSGTLHGKAFLGLPGNPVSAMVCGHLFLIPMIRKLLGQSDVLPQPIAATLGIDIAPNGPREHYMRATLLDGPEVRVIVPAERQDSALLTVLAEANALLIRPVKDPAREKGSAVKAILL